MTTKFSGCRPKEGRDKKTEVTVIVGRHSFSKKTCKEDATHTGDRQPGKHAGNSAPACAVDNHVTAYRYYRSMSRSIQLWGRETWQTAWLSWVLKPRALSIEKILILIDMLQNLCIGSIGLTFDRCEVFTESCNTKNDLRRQLIQQSFSWWNRDSCNETWTALSHQSLLQPLKLVWTFRCFQEVRYKKPELRSPKFSHCTDVGNRYWFERQQRDLLSLLTFTDGKWVITEFIK